ncbi:GTP pyrophosphokinase [Anaerotalea alkaliphila]|uniref:GTP pyrophosphokinase family protein n=1 Tax=Anaerotalea alkaliphila TaxID=2662126 RepID=A0A7X5KLJ2_9FIRM|nr:GTP pyrophosphokinase family protein [Anaerotalea alkaliphila]NDL66901.1 GTP pyrophosphokinase family protein [Anaerotalea alkaliphila]
MEIQMWREILIPYQQAVQELVIKFTSIRTENNKLGKYSPVELVDGRVKKISSILDKARKKQIPLDSMEEEIEDIAGLRIICQFVEDIDKVVEIIRSRSDMEIKYEKDYISNMKQSGYKSYHIIIYYDVHTALGKKRIQAEIQIRTLAMNFWATIEHSLQYKYKHNIPAEIRERLMKAAEAAHVLDEELSTIRSEIMEAQNTFQYKSGVIADILNNIQNIRSASENDREVEKIQEEFYRLWEEGNLEKLGVFRRQLDVIAENYRVQSLGDN